jgi:uncharacterized protein YndB with AHSA1/START domain
MSEGSSEAATAKSKALDLAMTRIFDAPRRLVFEVWKKREHVERWWGPHGFKTTVQEMDVRPGGKFRYVMSGFGDEYPFDGVYDEVLEPERLVITGTIPGMPGRIWTSVTFEEENGKTKLTVHQRCEFESDATRGAAEGWRQMLERLEEYVRAL